MLEWHGSPDTPYGYGLFADTFLPRASTWFKDNVDTVLSKAGRFDLLHLTNMPQTMFGQPHPLICTFNVTGANETYILKLDSDFGELYKRKRNSETRRANRRKDNRMLEGGGVAFRHVTDPVEIPAVINVMLEHKIARLAAEGIHGVFDAEICAMVQKLAIAKSGDALLFSTHVLEHENEIVACTFGGWLNGTYWFFISSIEPESMLAKHSPGDYALRKTIEQCCEAGLDTFDFGAGSASYKVGWTDETTQLFSSIRASTVAALPLATYEAGLMLLKGIVKGHPRLKALAFKLRRKFRSKRVVV